MILADNFGSLTVFLVSAEQTEYRRRHVDCFANTAIKMNWMRHTTKMEDMNCINVVTLSPPRPLPPNINHSASI